MAGTVQPLIDRFSGQQGAGPMNVDRGGPRLPPTVRHGSVSAARAPRFTEAFAVRGRARSRDRENGSSLPPPMFVRTIPVGPQEQMDFLEALEHISERMSAAERNHRNLAQTVASEIEGIKNIKEFMTTFKKDVEDYKTHISQCFTRVENTTEPIKVAIGTLQSLLDTVVTQNFKLLNDKVAALEIAVADSTRNAASYNISTPTAATGAQPMAFPHTAPGQSVPEMQRRSNVYDQPAAPQTTFQGNLFEEQAEQVGEAIPSPFDQVPVRANPAGLDSPFDPPATPPTAAPAVQSPPEATLRFLGGQAQPVPSTWQGIPSMYQGAAPVQYHAQQGQMQFGTMNPYRNPNDFTISTKKNEALRKFSGSSGDYETWANRMLDHMCESNQTWRPLLEKLKVCTEPIQKAWLVNQSVQGNNGWDLAVKLESFIAKWLVDSMYSRRVQLCGNEAQNGFEMWRLLFHEHMGGSAAINLGGMKRLQEWPRCNSVNTLSQMLDDWRHCLEKYNVELLNAPRTLYHMLLQVIPADFEDELLTRPEVDTWQKVMAWCKRKTAYKRTKALAELARKPATSSRISALLSESPDAS